MIGNNSASVLADAYLKGVKVEDVQTLYEGLINGTKNVHPEVSSTGRLGYEYYNKLGYVPYDVKINENTARTLEYAYNDWCIYRMAKELNRPKKEQKLFAERAMNYRNVFDKESKLMRGRNQDGQFQSPFSPLKWGDAFTEGNSWHYSWSVFHDPQGLIDLMGGKESFVEMLDSVFIVPPLFDDSYYGQVIHEIREMTVMNMGNYAHGNQPIQHMIYLILRRGTLEGPILASSGIEPHVYCRSRRVIAVTRTTVRLPRGMSSLHLVSIRFALVRTSMYWAPLCSRKATLHFENGKSLTIDAPDNSPENMYIESLKVNGVDYSRNYLTHGDLLNGGTLRFDMGSQPNMKRGTQPEDYPYSFSNELKK